MVMNDDLKRKVLEAEYISFDIFDTLVIRSCGKPDNVFRILGQRLGINSEKFRQARISAEKKARKLCNRSEISLSDIYMSFDCGIDIDDVIKEEVDTEKAVCIVNPDMMKLYQFCQNNGKKIILTSDMYLPQYVIENILHNLGYTDYEMLFLSSTLQKKKSSGKLFSYILKKLSIPAKNILHIGDNVKSDYLMPKLYGINSYHYKKISCNESCLNSLRTFINLKKPDVQESYFYDFGYKVFGPALYGYVRWLHRRLQELGISRIYFMAREGQIIKKAFDLIGENRYEEHYIYVSRRSLTIPAISCVSSIEDFLALRPIYGRVTVENQIGKLGLEKEKFQKYTWFNPKNLSSRFLDLDAKTKNIILRDMFQEAKKLGEKEIENVIRYLKQENMTGKIAIVDLGWNGSMQRALSYLLEKNKISVNMIGFFLAQRDEFYRHKNSIVNNGFLFNYGQGNIRKSMALNSGVSFLEFLFSADHGTTIKYSNNNGISRPVLDEYEYTNVYNIIRECQVGALDFIRDYKRKNVFCNEESIYFQPMYELLQNPDRKFLQHFGDVSISDFNEKDLFLAKEEKLLPLKKFINSFIDSAWKTAYLKRNLNTNKAFWIYLVLRVIFNRRK